MLLESVLVVWCGTAVSTQYSGGLGGAGRSVVITPDFAVLSSSLHYTGVMPAHPPGCQYPVQAAEALAGANLTLAAVAGLAGGPANLTAETRALLQTVVRYIVLRFT